MIRLTDTFLLASTKLKTRKIRLGVTVVISSLLFAGLTFLALITSGAIHSLQSFGQEGYGGRFIIQAMPMTYTGFGDDALTAELTPKNKTLIDQKKQLAKKLNLAYDEKTDTDLPIMTFQTGPGGSMASQINPASSVAQAALDAKNTSISGISYVDFQKRATSNGAIGTYRGLTQNFHMTSADQTYKVLLNGKEDYASNTNNGKNGSWESPKGVETITTTGWQTRSPELLTPFTLPGQNVALGKDGSIPVIAPYSAAEELLGLKSLPATATEAEKLDRLVKVRKEVAGQTAQICYRNSVSASMLAQAIQQQQEIAANKNNKDYIAPSLQYNLPATPCGPVTVKSDKRTDDEKKQANNQKIFDQTFGKATEPEQAIITIRIVGLNQDVNYQPGISATAIITSLFGSTLGDGWFSPNTAMDQNPVTQKIQGGVSSEISLARQAYYAEFTSLSTAESFMKSISCDSNANGPNGAITPADSSANIQNCAKGGRPFFAMPYGNSAGAVEQFRKGIWKVARFVILAVVIIAALVMMGNVGKIIADSRRETSVFRALGAKRLDIAQIYLTYTLLLCVLIIVIALVMGFAAASYLNSRYSPDISVNAVLAYNAQDVHKQFVLFGFDPLYIGGIALLVLAAGLLSSTLPLLTNMRRNPIRDMRDDS